MTEKVGITLGIVSPRRGRIPIEPVMLTADDALGATVTRGAAVGARTRGERGAVAAEDEGLEIPEEPALPGGEDATAEEEVFEASEQVLSTGLVSGRQQFLSQPLGDRIGWGAIVSWGGMALGLFVLQVAPMPPLALAAGPDVMGTRRGIRPIFQSVNEGIEGADSGRLEGRKARYLRQAWMGAQVVGPLRQTFVVEEEQQEEGAEPTEGIGGRSPAWAGGIQRTEHGSGRGQIEPQEDERGFMPRRREVAGLATEPALEL